VERVAPPGVDRARRCLSTVLFDCSGITHAHTPRLWPVRSE
jgi:hypothetical protein